MRWFFVLAFLFSLAWLFWPWGVAVPVFLGVYSWLWGAGFLAFLGLSPRRLFALSVAVSPFFVSAVFLPGVVALPLVVLGVAVVLVYAAVAKYGGWMGFLYVVFVNLVSTALMWATDAATGLATAANAVGLHPYERWETALFLALSAAYMGLGNIAVEQLYRAVGWKPQQT